MSASNRVPTFNLKAVVQETGLKPDTLRAWERRYGLPQPRRTESGHRIYSQRDIDILKWLIDRQDEGLSISRAVALWNRLREDGQNPLDEQDTAQDTAQDGIRVAARTHTTDSRTALAPTPFDTTHTHTGDITTGQQTSDLRHSWISACLAFDEQLAETILEQSFALFTPETVCVEILQKGLAEIGEGWMQGRITAQQEHFAASLAMRRLQMLLSTTPPPTRNERILIGCPPEEEHTFAPLLLSLILRRKGWPVIYLGANVPMRNLEMTIATARPALVILTAQQLHTASTLLEMGNLLYERHIPLAYGGTIFNDIPDIRKCIPGYFLGERIDMALQAIEQILLAPRPKDRLQKVPQSHVQALNAFREHRSQIEADVWRSLDGTEVSQTVLADANAFVGRNIIAALTLCDIGHLQHNVEWMLESLVNHHHMPSTLVDQYLDAYLCAITSHLHERGAVIQEWLHSVMGHEKYEAMAQNEIRKSPIW